MKTLLQVYKAILNFIAFMLEEELEKVSEFRDTNGYIDLQYMGVNNYTIKAISTLNCSKIIHLNLSRNQMTNETLLFLAKFPFINMTVLDIHWNNYNAEGVKYLVKGRFPSLTHLYMSGNQLGEEGIKALLLLPCNIREFGLSFTSSLVDQQIRERLEAKYEPIIRSKFPLLQGFLF